MSAIRGQALPVTTTPPVSTTPPTAASTETTIITADTQSYAGDIGTADGNVVVHHGEAVIYADHVIYDRSTKVVIANGDVRIFSDQRVYRGDSITYNLETKAMESSAFFSEEYPKLLGAKKVTTPGINHYRLTNASFTTSNREKPSFHLQAGTIEYRPNDEIVLKNVMLFVGDVPVFYFPVIVQSLTDSRPVYQFAVGTGGQFGAFIDNTYNWVEDPRLRGDVTLDYREKRGYAGGVDAQFYPTTVSYILLKSYYAQDKLYRGSDPAFPNDPGHGDLSNSNVYDGVPSENRFRLQYQQYLQFTPDLYSIANLNAWSDPWITRDYFQGEYQNENQPPNFVDLDQYNPNFNVSLLVSPQVNPFFETVERLPELLFETKQQKIFGSQVDWTSQSSLVNFQFKRADTDNFYNPADYIYATNPNANATPTTYNYYHPNAQYSYNTAQDNNYSAYRYDTYQEFAYPHQYFNFLSLTPRIGGRFTYYSDDNQELGDTVNNNGLASDQVTNPKARFAANAGLAGDFKVSRTWTDVSDPNLGINGIRHVFEPFFDSDFAPAPTVRPNEIRGFDNQIYNTALQPLDQTQLNSIDSLDREAVVRFGFWNKIQTKRDGANYDLLSWQTYADADFDHNFSASTPNSTLSNLFNDIRFYPIPKLSFQSLTSVDIQGRGYDEAQNNIVWAPDASLQLSVGYYYLSHSAIFGDSNSTSLDFFYRMNEHWQVEAQESFQATTGHLQLQQYTLYRDLDAWQMAMTVSDSEISDGHDEQAIYFSLTLKALPGYTLHTPHL